MASEKVLFSGKLIDGSVSVALPNWQHLRFASLVTQGSETINGNGDLVVSNPAMAVAQWAITVQQTNGKTVYFGYSWDGGPVQQSPSTVTVDSNSPITITNRDLIDMSAGTTLTLYLSSNNDNQGTFWSAGEITFLQPAPAAVEQPPTDAHYVLLSGQWKRRDGHGVQKSVTLAQHVTGSPPIGTQLDPWVKRDVPAIDEDTVGPATTRTVNP